MNGPGVLLEKVGDQLVDFRAGIDDQRLMLLSRRRTCGRSRRRRNSVHTDLREGIPGRLVKDVSRLAYRKNQGARKWRLLPAHPSSLVIRKSGFISKLWNRGRSRSVL